MAVGLFAVALGSLAFAGIGAMHDGLSNRARDEKGRMVGWWPWHLVNWLRRDLLVALAYFWMLENGANWVDIAFLIALNYHLHNKLYLWSVRHRHLFLWGRRAPRWWPFRELPGQPGPT